VVAPARGNIDAVTVREVPLPTPGPGQVLLSVRAVGVNPTDWKSMHRTWPREVPLLLGYEAAGVVAALGPDSAKEFSGAVGDTVIAYPVLGAYATELVVPVGDVLAIPTTLNFPQAANLLLVGTTAAEMLAVTDIRPGETVLVHGASSATGISLLQQLAPLQVKIVATSGERNFDLVRRFGAQPVTYGPGLVERVWAVAPDGINVALDCVGTNEAIDVSVELVANRDRIVTIANAERAAQVGFRHLNGMEPPSLAYRNDQRRRLIDMATEGTLIVPIAQTLPLTEARQALDILRAGHPGGKLALIP